MDSDTDSDDSIGIELTATHQTVDRTPVIPVVSTDQPPILPPLSFASPIDASAIPESGSSSAGGWWDVVSAVQTQPPAAPWHDNLRSTTRKRTTSGGFSSLPVPPGAEPASIPQAEPRRGQLQTIGQDSSLKAIPQPVSPLQTPDRPTPPRLSTGTPTAPQNVTGPNSPSLDFSKRQSDATLAEEVGNLMISPDRPSQTTSQVVSTDVSVTPSQSSVTPVVPRFNRSGSTTPGTGSPSRAVPSQPFLHRSQAGTPVRQTVDLNSDSDSDSDDNHAVLHPSQSHVSPQQYRPKVQPSPVLPPNRASAAGIRASPVTAPANTKTKTRGWKSVSAAIGITKDRERSKEKERESNEKVVRTANRAWPENDPGRWNKNMVANIMGPSAAERR